jgi:hypothetical protein
MKLAHPRTLVFLTPIAAVALTAAPALATVDMYAGPPVTFANAPIADCSTKAKTALDSALTGAVEIGTGTGMWVAKDAPDPNTEASAAVHCFPTADGYIVSFTCAVETRAGGQTASDLCAKISKAFGTP